MNFSNGKRQYYHCTHSTVSLACHTRSRSSSPLQMWYFFFYNCAWQGWHEKVGVQCCVSEVHWTTRLMRVTAVSKAHPLVVHGMTTQCTSMTTAPCLFLWLPDSYSPSHVSSCVWKGSRAAMTLPLLCCTHITLIFGVADFLSSARTDRRLWSVPSHSNAQQGLHNRTLTSLYSEGGRGFYTNRTG